jgi:hypothetical protein
MNKLKKRLITTVALLTIIIALSSLIIAGIVMCETPFTIIQTSLYLLTALTAIWAVIVSINTANTQNKLMEQEWLPYLSYEKMHGSLVKGVMGMNPEFFIVLKNNGRCILQYEISEVAVVLLIHYVELINEKETGAFIPAYKKHTLEPKSVRSATEIKGVIGINSQIAQSCGIYQFLLEEKLTGKVDEYVRQTMKESGVNFNTQDAYVFQINFVVKYGKKGDDKNNYSLKYAINMAYKDGKFIESIGYADIDGY